MSDDAKKPSVRDEAQRLFKEYYASCFWHWKPDLVVTDEMVPAIIKGLCTFGGRRGLAAAARLQGVEEK